MSCGLSELAPGGCFAIYGKSSQLKASECIVRKIDRIEFHVLNFRLCLVQYVCTAHKYIRLRVFTVDMNSNSPV